MIDESQIEYLLNGERAEADVLNRPLRQLVNATNDAISDSANSTSLLVEKRYDDVFEVTKDGNGFTREKDAQLIFDANNATVSIAPGLGKSAWFYYHKGRKIESSETLTYTLSEAEKTDGGFYLSFDKDRNLVNTGPYPDFFNTTLCFYVHYSNGEFIIEGDERHTADRDTAWHVSHHREDGMVVYTLGSVDWVPDDANNVGIQITSTLVADEDLQHLIIHSPTGEEPFSQILEGSQDTVRIPTLYYDGSIRYLADKKLPWVVDALKYNDGTTIVDVPDGKFVNYFLAATNCQKYPIKLIMGRKLFDSDHETVDETLESLGLNLPEMALLYRISLERDDSLSTVGKCVLKSVQQAASKITFESAAGSAGSGLSNHTQLLGRTDDNAHPISAITGLQTVLSEVSNRLIRLETPGVSKPTITTSGTNLNWNTEFTCTEFASIPTTDSIEEEEWTLYQNGEVVRSIVKISDFHRIIFPLTTMKEGTYYTLRVRQRGVSLGWSEQSDAFSFKSADVFDKVYGVALLEGGNNGGTLAHVDIEGNIIELTKSDFDAHPIWGNIEDQIVDDQHMVRIPKYYSKYERRVVTGVGAPVSEVPVWYISDKPLDAFETYPAFFDAGEEVDQFWYGKYQATIAASKMRSVPGVMPIVNISLNQFKTAAEQRNVDGVDGFMILSWYQMSAIQWLYLIENATFDSQAKTGQGRVNASSAANVDATDVAQATYRGIVGLWGNVHDWIDGFIWNPTTGIRVWDRLGNKSWVETGKFYTLPLDSHQYPLTHMEETGVDFDLSDGFIGETGSANISTGTVSDSNYFGKTAQDNVPNVGGSYGLGTSAGLWYFLVNSTATNTPFSIASRLAKV